MTEGRWPTNVILDPTAAAQLDRETGVRRDGACPAGAASIYGNAMAERDRTTVGYGGEGGASRFFPVLGHPDRPPALLAADTPPGAPDVTAPYYTDDAVTLWHGDALDVLRTLPDNSVDAVVTDPPAGVSFMSRSWDDDKGGREHWSAWLAGIMREALRVTKPGGHALVWALPRTSHWTACGLEDAGWIIRDRISHLFGSGFPKALDVARVLRPTDPDEADRWEGWATALKPSAEDWWLCRKPLVGTVAQNVTTYGTGALNIAATRVMPPGSVGSSPAGSTGCTCPEPADGRTCRSPSMPRPASSAAAREPRSARPASAPAHEPGPTSIPSSLTGCPSCRGSGGGHARRGGVGDQDAAPSLAGARGSRGLQPTASRSPESRPAGRPSIADELDPPCEAGGVGAARMPYGNSSGNVERAVPAGRWPTNAVLDSAAAAQLDRETGVLKSGALKPYTAAAGDRVYGHGLDKGERAKDYTSEANDGGASRFFPTFAPPDPLPAWRYEPKAPTAERPRVAADGVGQGRVVGDNFSGKVRACNVCGDRTIRTGETKPACGHSDFAFVPTAARAEHVSHPTVKPLDLIRWLTRLITPPGGTILDCFAGSGTTGEAAVVEGFRAILIEREAAYLPLIVARLSKPIQPDLFGAVLDDAPAPEWPAPEPAPPPKPTRRLPLADGPDLFGELGA